MAVKKGGKKKTKKFVEQGIVNIQATFNNTIITISDQNGNVIAWSSGGMKGFKGTRKGTPFAAQIAAEDAAKKAATVGMKTVSVYVKGPGPGREPAIRSLQASGLKITYIR
ncbi:MAG: 30S ribosomal protein S11, partial [Candidatus Dadabacteria bacterium]